MTAPAPRPSLTPLQLVDGWKVYGAELVDEAHATNNPVLMGEGEQLKSCADELAAALAGMTCANCRWLEPQTKNAMCKNPTTPVLGIGRPKDFGCLAHAPRTDGEK